MNPFIQVGCLTEDQVRSAITAATLAPSLHNSQPWRFRCTPISIELHADLSRELPAADPDRREMLLACGAALLNLRLAIRTCGVDTDVRIIPDPTDPTLLASILPGGHISATSADRKLCAAISLRHTDRRPFLNEPVPEALRNSLRQATRVEQAWLATVSPAQQSQLRDLLALAHRSQQDNAPFMAEWARWTGREGHSVDGVLADSAGPRPEQQDMWVLRDFSAGTARTRLPGKDFESDPLIAVIGSFNDLPLAQLQAGQAMQRMLLTATAAGLSASFLSQVIEVPGARRQLRELIGGALWPQAVLRLGYSTPISATPRRSPAEVVGSGTVAGRTDNGLTKTSA